MSCLASALDSCDLVVMLMGFYRWSKDKLPHYQDELLKKLEFPSTRHWNSVDPPPPKRNQAGIAAAQQLLKGNNAGMRNIHRGGR